jgi:hypothetical protein
MRFEDGMINPMRAVMPVSLAQECLRRLPGAKLMLYGIDIAQRPPPFVCGRM